MVRFEDNKLVIELKAETTQDALDKWVMLHSAFCDLIRNVNDENICENFHNVTDFLEELMPDWEDAKKMIV